MSRRAAGALAALALALLVVALLIGRRSPPSASEAPAASAAPESAEAPAAAAEPRTVTLWLPAAAGKLGVREVEVASGAEPRERVRALLAALLAAPEGGGLTPVFPLPVEAAAVVLVGDGTLYLDLRGADGGEPPGAGSTLELQRVYALVHTVVRNEPSISRVALLWNGVQRLSLCGHVDTSHPLAPLPELEQP
jgi:hypothetical protein